MEKQTDKTKIQDWFEKTDFEGSIVLQFKIDREQNTVLLMTSYPMGSHGDFHYKFRLTLFGGVKKLKREGPGSDLYQSVSENYESKLTTGTIELEDFRLRTYPTNYQVGLNFGHNFGFCEFEYDWIHPVLKKGRIIRRQQEEVIVDIDTNEILEFNNPIKINDTTTKPKLHSRLLDGQENAV